MSCGMELIKYLLFIFNFIFALCGLAILVVGVLIHVEWNSYQSAVEENITFPAVSLIVIGSIIFIIAFFGCCGAIRESHCMTVTFASFLLTILIIQVAIAIYVFVAFKESNINITGTYESAFDNYWKSSTTQEVIDAIQKNLRCCGVESYRDFNKFSNSTIPWSCCDHVPENQTCPASDAFSDGCADAVKRFLIKAGKILGGVALGIAGVEFIGIVFALCLANSIRNIERRGYRV